MRRLVAHSLPVALVVALTACAAPEPSNFAAVQREDVYHFDSLAQMAATADVVVEGLVTSVEKGRTIEVAHGAGLQFVLVSLGVKQVFAGKVDGTIVLEEEATRGFEAGQHGVFFLHLKQDDPAAGYYRLVNSQSEFLFVDGVVTPSSDEDIWIQKLESLDAASFEDLVRVAVEDDVAPATPVLGST